MTRLILLAAAVASPALAQEPTQLQPPPEFIQSAQAFGQCVGRQSQAAGTTATPEAAAHGAVTACATEKAALSTRFEAWVASDTFPAAGRDMAREQFAAQMNGVEASIAERIRASRTGAATAPAPVPAPSATPTSRR